MAQRHSKVLRQVPIVTAPLAQGHARRSARCKRVRGFTLIEILIVMTIIGFLMAGVMAFLVDSVRTTFVTEQKLEINGDIRDVTNTLADEAREANYFTLYSTFYSDQTGDPPGDFRDPPDGYTPEDYRQRKGNSGDFVLFVFTGIDTNPADDTPAPILRLVGYFRDGGVSDKDEAPVRRFEINVPAENQDDPLESLIPASASAKKFPTVINLVTGLANGDLFYNIEDRSILVNGKIIHGNAAKRVTGTYNFTVSPRG